MQNGEVDFDINLAFLCRWQCDLLQMFHIGNIVLAAKKRLLFELLILT